MGLIHSVLNDVLSIREIEGSANYWCTLVQIRKGHK
jgi:hypothetical protein